MEEKLFKKRLISICIIVAIFTLVFPLLIKTIYTTTANPSITITSVNNGTFNITFDNEIYINNKIVVKFYDHSGELLFTAKHNPNSVGKVFRFKVDGDLNGVAHIEIASLKISPPFQPTLSIICYFFTGFFVILFILALNLRIKEYTYNENQILVYAGFTNHYIKINGEKRDEHITSISFTPIILSCDLDAETKIKATISLSNNITLKINDKLYNNK